jgi:predicted nucleic acid-binding protein
VAIAEGFLPTDVCVSDPRRGSARPAHTARRPPAQADMLIAVTAALHGLTLATRDERDFEDCGVTVVNPFD